MREGMYVSTWQIRFVVQQKLAQHCKAEKWKSCLTVCDPVDCSPPGSSVHGIFPGKNTGVGSHFLLQGISPIQGLNRGLPHCRQILNHLNHQGSHCKATLPQFFKLRSFSNYAPPGHEALGPHLKPLATAGARVWDSLRFLLSQRWACPSLCRSPFHHSSASHGQPRFVVRSCLFAWLPEYLACSSRERSNFIPFLFVCFLSSYLLHFYPIHTGNSWEQGLCGFPILLHPSLPTQCLTGSICRVNEWVMKAPSLFTASLSCTGWDCQRPSMGYAGTSSVGKESACNAGDPGLIPGLGRSAGEGISYPLQYTWSSFVTQLVKNLPAMWETSVCSLGWEDPLEKAKATHPSILAWIIPWIV